MKWTIFFCWTKFSDEKVVSRMILSMNFKQGIEQFKLKKKKTILKFLKKLKN